MKIKHCSYLLQATYSIILITVTYATSAQATDSQQQRQAEVSTQHLPTRQVKFGERVPQQNAVFLPTPLPPEQQNASRQSRRQQSSVRNDLAVVPSTTASNRNREQRNQSSARTETKSQSHALASRGQSNRNAPFLPTPLPKDSRSEHITLPTHSPAQHSHLARRHNAGGSGHNQLVVQQYDIPVVQKSHANTIYKPITSAVGQSQQQQLQQHQQHLRQQQQQLRQPPTNANRSRLANKNLETPRPASHSNQQLTAVTAKTTTTRINQPPQKSQQQQSSLTLPARTSSHNNSQDPTLASSRNSNHESARINNKKSTEAGLASHQNQHQRGNNQALSRTNGASSHKTASSSSQARSTVVSSTNAQHHSRSNTRKSGSATTTSRPLFSLPNEYNIFSPDFWQFLNPTTKATPTNNNHTNTITTTKRPPKKYIPSPEQASPKDEKQNYPKTKTTTTHQPTKTTKIPEYRENHSDRKDEGPFRIALPTFNILRNTAGSTAETEKEKRDVEEDEELRAKVNCPRESEVRFQLFPKICKVDDDCKVWNRGEICCEIFGAKSCVTGIPKPLEETSHSPILGLIPRKCPDRPLAELWWEVKECDTDMDCWPRVCCPDGRRRYCRTSQPELNTVPVPVKRSFNYLTEYLECTAPPPRIFDLHPKACTSTLDCFPNVCCQEAGLRHCRPPKKSVLTMFANVFNVDLVKRLTQNIVIK